MITPNKSDRQSEIEKPAGKRALEILLKKLNLSLIRKEHPRQSPPPADLETYRRQLIFVAIEGANSSNRTVQRLAAVLLSRAAEQGIEVTL